jgi:hypothetical protein
VDPNRIQNNRKKPDLGVISTWITSVLAAVMSIAIIACSPAKWHETSAGKPTYQPVPFTGDPLAERQTTNKRAGDFKPGDHARVRPTRVCGRRLPDAPCSKETPPLEQNDEVVVVDSKPEGKDGKIKVQVTKSDRPDYPKEPVYVPPQYITDEPFELSTDELNADRYFVVQNIATEKLRIYERCKGENCHHRLILETDMVVGQNTKERRSLLGSFSITKWFKFYEDNDGSYPSWYNPAYPQAPTAGASVAQWGAKDQLPGYGSVRGAFGWYTAYLAPNADEQWIHGTWGWGADGDNFIQALRSSPLDKDSRFASHGCTRVENQAIALMREILVPGTKVIRIYARESYANAESKTAVKKAKAWDWILTKSGVNQENGSRSGRRDVVKGKIKKSDVLEHGSYTPDMNPKAVLLTDNANSHENGNSYGLSVNSFQGTFFVDEGRVTSDYEHPKGLEVGGHPDGYLPAVVLSK